MRILLMMMIVSLHAETTVQCMDRVLGNRDVLQRLTVIENNKKRYGKRYFYYYKAYLEVRYPEVIDSCTTTLPPDTIPAKNKESC